MNDDWQIGDLAWCVNVDYFQCSCGCTVFTGKDCPPKGSVREVADVRLDEKAGALDRCGEHLTYLVFTDKSEGILVRFRKIRPHNPDKEDAETVRLLNGAPVRESV